MTTAGQRTPADSQQAHLRCLLPSALLDLPLAHLPLEAAITERLQTQRFSTVGDLLSLPLLDVQGRVAAADLDAVRESLGRAVQDGLWQLAVDAPQPDWPTLRARLQAPLEGADHSLFAALLGFDGPPASRTQVARRLGLSMLQFDEHAAQIRARLLERATALLGRLRYEMGRELEAGDGVRAAAELARDSLLAAIASSSGDALLPLRLCAFLFPRQCHHHGDGLFALSPPRFRKLLRTLPRLVTQDRLPRAIGELTAVLAAEGLPVPRRLLLHVLRTELRIAIAVTVDDGGAPSEVAVPDPRSTTTRLADLLLEAGRPMQIENLVFAYRERFRRARRLVIEQRLASHSAFVLLGASTWSLRAWHEQELATVAPLVDKVVRRICTEGGRQKVAPLLAEQQPDERTLWLVLDRMAVDPRVRMLGRGEACPATHTRSRVLEQTLHDLGRAGGEVVLSMFVANQAMPRRRLIERLLRWNRLLVSPAPDRIDLLSNYPFNDERLRRLTALLQKQLQQRAGYANAAALKAVLDRTDLGGGWLTPELLTDLLRRNGPFEVLPGGIIARKGIGLRASLMRTVRQALRDAGHPVSVADVVRERPDLIEFEASLCELLREDPLVRGADSDYFSLL